VTGGKDILDRRLAPWAGRFSGRLGWARKWTRPAAVGLTLALAAAGIVELRAALSDIGVSIIGLDIGHYLDGTRRWLDTGSPYLQAEVAASFDFGPLTFLHPPLGLWLFLPFLFLPAVLWWAIPLGVVASLIVSWRPAPWTWPLMVGALVFSRFHVPLIVGNTDLWVWAGVAAGLRFGWPALVVAVKPSLGPLVLAGARHRSWWIGAAIVAAACIPFGALWLDWLAVIRHSPFGLTYSISNLPWLVVPIVAWAARSRTVHPRSVHPRTAGSSTARSGTAR
jgi:hypothetical protein